MSGTMFVGRDGVNTFRAIALKSGLRLYAKTGMQPNRAWSPSVMLAAAEEIVGQRFKRGQYVAAADALEVWIAKHGTTGEKPHDRAVVEKT